MKVLFVSSEVTPYAKTGGLGDVAGALPPALRRLGVDIRLAMPEYACIAETGLVSRHSQASALIPIGDQLLDAHLHLAEHRGVPLLLVRNREFFMRSGLYGDAQGDYPDNGERFAFFCRALLRLLPQLDFRPDVIHLNDWQSALLAVLLRHELAEQPFFAPIGSLLTIHNLGYGGRFPATLLPRVGLDPSLNRIDALEFYGDISFLKGGIVFCDRVNTVSPRYAEEICTPGFGHGLDGLLTQRRPVLSGILNGLDVAAWNPLDDPALPRAYGPDDLSGKTTCKRELQKELGLSIDDTRPLLGMVTRLDTQKGIDLLETAWPLLEHEGAQLALVGSGDPRHARQLSELAARKPGQTGVTLRFDEALARRIYAGSDLFLMPSRYEPCGLSQMIALRYGSVPVVRDTGGLADTIRDADAHLLSGNGFSFSGLSGDDLAAAVSRGIAAWRRPDRWQEIVRRGMREDFSWEASAAQYLELYQTIAGERT